MPATRYLVPGTTQEQLKAAEGPRAIPSCSNTALPVAVPTITPPFFELLVQHNYRGWISIEDGMNGMEEMQQSLTFLREMVDKYYP